MESSNDERVPNRARWYIARSLACGRGDEPPEEDDPDAVRRYVLDHAPPVYDPFCGGGSIRSRRSASVCAPTAPTSTP